MALKNPKMSLFDRKIRSINTAIGMDYLTLKEQLYTVFNFPLPLKKPKKNLHFLAAGGQTPAPLGEFPAKNDFFFFYVLPWRNKYLILYACSLTES